MLLEQGCAVLRKCDRCGFDFISFRVDLPEEEQPSNGKDQENEQPYKARYRPMQEAVDQLGIA